MSPLAHLRRSGLFHWKRPVILPATQLVIIPNVGHVPQRQVPDIFNRELLKFLNLEEQN